MAQILVVEDNPAIGMVIQIALTDEGHQVELRKNGLEGLSLMESGRITDLVITDLIMEKMSGRDLIRTMRNDHQMCSIPVVIITGCIPNFEIFPEENQFQGLLLKPFNLEDLIAIVARLTSTVAA